ncbi:MAG: hypothetical protein RMJ33_03950 [Saprospiraceae bacterium]|nr:hypothetical protein [Saprospiraceae bacterium]MDW8228974.1 hypothetical protein [Saprospiraceae bacterium]
MCAQFWDRKYASVLLLVAFLGKSLVGTSQPGEEGMKVICDSSAVETGAAFKVQLRLDAMIVQPVYTDLSGWFEHIPRENVLAHTPWERREGEWRQEITLIFFEPGEVVLPPLPVILLQGDTLRTAPIQIRVFPTPTPEDEASWRDIKALWPTPSDGWERWRLWIGVVLALMLSGAGAYWLLRRRRLSRPSLEQVRASQPWEIALEQMNALEQRRLWQREVFDGYYTELSRIVREYLERQYGIPALESSTEETLRYCKTTSIPQHLLPALEELLYRSDLVKFARVRPPEYYHAQALREARRLVEQTALALAATADERPSSTAESLR